MWLHVSACDLQKMLLKKMVWALHGETERGEISSQEWGGEGRHWDLLCPFSLAVVQPSSVTGPSGAAGREAELSTIGAFLALPLRVQSRW